MTSDKVRTDILGDFSTFGIRAGGDQSIFDQESLNIMRNRFPNFNISQYEINNYGWRAKASSIFGMKY